MEAWCAGVVISTGPSRLAVHCLMTHVIAVFKHRID